MHKVAIMDGTEVTTVDMITIITPVNIIHTIPATIIITAIITAVIGAIIALVIITIAVTIDHITME